MQNVRAAMRRQLAPWFLLLWLALMGVVWGYDKLTCDPPQPQKIIEPK